MSNVPSSRPQITRAQAEAILQNHGVTAKVAMVGIRGYYLDSMGAKGKNDRGMYDDAILVVSPTKYFAFNGNTDPSVFRTGIATLKPGIHPYRKGKHGITRPGGGYPALRPATPGEALPVTRDGVATAPRPGVAINIHRGSLSSTSSEGCQTIYPPQWAEFVELVYQEMDKAGQKTVPYLLVEEPAR